MTTSLPYTRTKFLQRLQFWEDTPRRRRRRAPVSPASSSLTTVGTSEPLKTPEVVRHVVSRLTPPTSPPIQPTPTPTRPQQSEQSVHLSNTFQPIHPASSQVTHSAPSTLDSRSRSSDETCRLSVGYGERQERSETDEILRKVPPKLAPLRKPDIPDVLRPKESATVASPGVVNTPPNSRPSSVVLEKPPLAPEGLRPATFRSSLRKPETGTCFMAARREKRDDIKPEFYREIQPKPKKGDRLSKSDMNLKMDSNFAGKVSDTSSVGEEKFEACGATSSPTLPTSNSSAIFSEEMMSSRLEALTARARDTLKRADRLIEDVPPPLPENGPPEDSADNVVHECQQYLTVNANIKESNPRIHHRELNLGTESSSDNLQTLPAIKGIISDTGQKNGVGGSEGHGKESKRMAMEKEMSKEMKRDPFQSSVLERNNIAFAVPSGPPKQSSVTSDHISSPKEEVLHGAQQTRYWDNEMGAHDTSVVRSSDSTLVKSPDHNESKWGSQRCSLDGDNSRTNSPDPLSILKRKSSREDLPNTDRPPTPEPHSILKRKTSSRNSSIDIHEGDPKPILKKKSSAEELDHFEPRPILKKKSSTDDELDDRPRSILKGGRSREDIDITEGVVSPYPILKRSPRYDSEGEGELRPILKRRETTDGVRLRLHVSDGEDVEGETPSVRLRSDSAPEAAIRMRGRSPPAPSATPTHGILKKRGSHSPGRFDQMDNELGAILRSRRSNGSDADEGNEIETQARPVSPSLVALTRRENPNRSGERPLSVAERVAGMEAARQEPTPVRQRSPTPTRSPGARPKITPPSSLERPSSLIERDSRDSRRNSAFGLVPDSSHGDSVEAINEALLDRPVGEVYSNAVMSRSLETSPDTPSSVSQKAAFFAQLEQKTLSDTMAPKRGTRFSHRRDRGTRHATQPVTEDEVSRASRLAEASDSAAASHDSDSSPRRDSRMYTGILNVLFEGWQEKSFSHILTLYKLKPYSCKMRYHLYQPIALFCPL
ncbi:hypothetical protein SK128_005945 [Halocaridina rubra]|uniref:Uncharacterized protein n=1 Tax=Halocaridina rubra TaxID=373956 RepID=A0AAN8WDH6_HALRR